MKTFEEYWAETTAELGMVGQVSDVEAKKHIAKLEYVLRNFINDSLKK